MQRRERRTHRRRVRRIGIVVASLAMIASTVGFGGVASARNTNNGPACSNTNSGVAHSDNSAYGWCF